MLSAFIGSLIMIGGTMVALAIGPVFRKQNHQCSCKKTQQLMTGPSPKSCYTPPKQSSGLNVLYTNNH